MKWIFILALLGPSRTGWAQQVGFGDGEIRLLQNWLGSPHPDSSLIRLYGLQKATADRALDEGPHPIDTIRSEGLLQGDPKKTATQAALHDMAKMYALALIYRVEGGEQYLRQAVRYLRGWARVDHPRGDPIDDTNLDPAIEAFDMVKAKLSKSDDTAVRSWLRATADAELTAKFNRPDRATSYNNWHSHRLKIVGEIGYALGDTALEGYALRGLRAQIARNLRPDGESEDFVTRDALHYDVYDLEPLIKLAMVVERATGENCYDFVSPTGSSIRKSVEWLLPYLDGTKTHAEFVNSTVEFDRRRAANGEAAYKAGTLFDPRNGVMVLELAGYFEPGLMEMARKVSGNGGKFPGWQAVVSMLTRTTRTNDNGL